MTSSDNVTIRVSDGREVDLGSPGDVLRTLTRITEANGGSSGVGRWSWLFGFAPNADETLEADDADRLAEEAHDYKITMALLLDDQAVHLLDRIASLSDTHGLSSPLT